MTPAFCRIKHDPERGTYGDCLRACVASILDVDSEDVPHFYHDNCDGVTGNERLREWLRGQSLSPFVTSFTGDATLDEVLTLQQIQNPGLHYILFVGIDGGDHVVVCQGDKIVHDPAWYRMRIEGPPSHGLWTIMVLARV